MILLPDSREAEPLRTALAAAIGQGIPTGVMAGLSPRQMIEPVLKERVDAAWWHDEPWQIQIVLPVAVATRDGFQFGFFALDTPPE